MRTIKTLSLALAAVSVFGALSATGAVAHEWQVDEAQLAHPFNVTGKSLIEFNEKTKGWQVMCQLVDNGTVGPGAKGKITSITGIAKEKTIGCLGLGPSECKSPTIEAINLPWTTELVTVGGELRNAISASGFPFWKLTCAGVVDYCESNTTAAVKNYSAGVEAIFDEKSPVKACGFGSLSTTGTEKITLVEPGLLLNVI